MKMVARDFFGMLLKGSSVESEEPIMGNTCGCLDHQGLSALPANQPMKVDSVTGRSFKAGDERAARHPGTECTTVSWRWPEFLTSLRKLSKADRLLSFPRDGHIAPGHI